MITICSDPTTWWTEARAAWTEALALVFIFALELVLAYFTLQEICGLHTYVGPGVNRAFTSAGGPVQSNIIFLWLPVAPWRGGQRMSTY